MPGYEQQALPMGILRWLLQTGSGVGADPEDRSCSSALSARGSETLILYGLQIVSAFFRIRRELSRVRPGLLPFDRGWWLTGHVKKNRINLAFPQADYFVRHLVNQSRR